MAEWIFPNPYHDMKTLKPRVSTTLPARTRTPTGTKRITGRKLQEIRFEMWKTAPHCKKCGKMTAYPYGFEVDHATRLTDGGAESAENRQLLCLECHTEKTKLENSSRSHTSSGMK